ncbi:Bifunctional monodehydroascorbate reductase and carbonic anhydrase nectarin-3 [Triticum urartu]|uniref:Carbonic anhydrase n=1 Tax=Triticum urartu TaxID=4572 RepID=M7YX94_TRIUA|nr:Bifunctional monodehydroascorbate reductase and carbonic anhydrase nectarin-3 [Triticum urartu]
MRSARDLRLAVSALLLLLLLSAGVLAARAQHEIDDESEFSYIRGSENGPENWGKIKEEWATCGTGRMQSPIDLSDRHAAQAPNLRYLNHSYLPVDASIINRGHDIMVKFNGDAGSLWINGTAYHLKQVHWHSPSEHRVNGRRYSLELHMVHLSADNKTAVIGILYKIGRRDHFLHELEPYLKRIADTKEKEEMVGMVDPWEARGDGEAYYRYMGSLTTPACDEGVIWTVIKRGFEMNARPLQKVNGRDINFFCPDDHHERYYAAADQ